ncbi:MAG: DUF4271 domain-containing protein [Chitinophagaceae bacterium]
MKLLLSIILLLFGVCVNAQTDALKRADTSLSVHPNQDSSGIAMHKPAINFDSILYSKHPFYRFTNPVQRVTSERTWQGKEVYFYITVALLIFFASVKNGFSKYLHDIFRLFFRATLRQRQIKDQLMQAPLPSLLLNIFFILSGALFLTLLFQRLGWGIEHGFLLLYLYCIAGLSGIYLVKFLTLRMCGWLFRLKGATDAYTFIVFTTNKIIGILLLPFIVLLIFTNGLMNQVVFTGCLLLIAAMFIYRFYLSYAAIHRLVKLNLLHFIIYLCAFEIAPLLLINKLLFTYFTESP